MFVYPSVKSIKQMFNVLLLDLKLVNKGFCKHFKCILNTTVTLLPVGCCAYDPIINKK